MPIPKHRPAVGWYRLPKSGHLYHGTLPEGVEPLDDPPIVEGSAPVEQPVDAVEDSGTVPPEVASDDLPADADQVVVVPGDGPVDEHLDEDLDGHGVEG